MTSRWLTPKNCVNLAALRRRHWKSVTSGLSNSETVGDSSTLKGSERRRSDLREPADEVDVRLPTPGGGVCIWSSKRY